MEASLAESHIGEEVATCQMSTTGENAHKQLCSAKDSSLRQTALYLGP